MKTLLGLICCVSLVGCVGTKQGVDPFDAAAAMLFSGSHDGLAVMRALQPIPALERSTLP